MYVKASQRGKYVGSCRSRMSPFTAAGVMTFKGRGGRRGDARECGLEMGR